MERNIEARGEAQVFTPYSEPVSFYNRTQYSQKLYIGSNNQTHKVDIDIITDFLNKKLEGYTYWLTTGYWIEIKDNKRIIYIENSIIVEILADKPPLTQKDIEELRDLLKQSAILTSLNKIEVALV